MNSIQFIEYALLNSKPKLKVRIQAEPPISLERQFQNEVQSLVKPFFKKFRNDLLLNYEKWKGNYSLNLDSDEEEDKSDIEIFFSNILKGLGIYFSYKVLKSLISNFVQKIFFFSKNKLSNQMEKIFGLKPFYSQENLKIAINLWVEKNITKLNNNLIQYVNNNKLTIYSMFEKEEKGKDYLKKQVIENELKFESSIAFLARDQVSGLDGLLTKILHAEIGLDNFIWSTCRDDKVRPTHRALEGKLCSWSNLPKSNGISIFPSSENGCRCVARPIVSRNLI
ncbi:phage minor head protein (plasmid) [Pigmentibacter ruber]